MPNDLKSKSTLSQPPMYQIRIKGQLDSQWSDWFSGMTLSLDNGDTLMTGQVIDQAALHGLLKKVRDLGMPLVSVVQIQVLHAHQNDSEEGEK